MSKKGGGGGYDTSGMEQATKEATALQKEMYDQTREDLQPWYGAGEGGISKLSDLLGITGGSVQDRQGIYDELLPQYQTTTATQAAPYGSNETPEGYGRRGAGWNDPLPNNIRWALRNQSPGETTSTSTNYEGLNTAVDERFANQETPDDYGSLLDPFSMEHFEQDPGAEYRRSEAQKALERSMAAQGVTLGGGGYGEINPQVAKALEEQQQGIASQEYGAAYNRYNNDQTNVYNRLMGISGMGQQATGQLQQAGQNYGTNVGNLQTGLASAQAQAAAAEAAQPSMFSQVLSTGAQLAPLFMSDENLKENLELMRVENGYNIYKFNYINDKSTQYEGVIAQEVQEIVPDAVVLADNGFLAVDYDKIGLKMERV